MQTWHIHINGIVQGVGFRPFVYQLAKEMRLNGYVKNGNDGVHIFMNASEQDADLLLKKIKQVPPARAKIISIKLYKAADENFTDFSVDVENEDGYEKRVLMPPDVAMCNACRKELHDENNRRYRYPFITCTQCGPRYSIMKSIPYERENTSMEYFDMCENCLAEYDDTFGRRFFSQTNSCPQCKIGFNIWEKDTDTVPVDSEMVLRYMNDFLKQGKIVAVKGIGGYLLLCDANNEAAIQLLRIRKHRPSKPFAVLYPGIEIVMDSYDLNRQEQLLLESDEAPVVLLYPKEKIADALAVKDIAPGLKRLGIMLPNSPLLELIATDFGKPLIATSANISGSPIIYKDEDALNYLFSIADYIVDYDRPIIIPEDDSVVLVSKYSRQQIILRRSRGYAPSFLQYKPKKEITVISTGAFLKSSFALSINGNVFVSQFLGSGESYESQQMYKNTLEHWIRLYSVKPAVILTDKHPDYFSHRYAVELAGEYKSEIRFVQHHEAHFAAVLAENNLLQTPEPVLGVIWDGTGLGSDGNIWGGEFFRYENKEINRCAHLDYYPAIAGDKPALEPRIAALCAASTSDAHPELLKEKFTEPELNNYKKLIETTRLFSSSMGRIFDAIASLLGICDKQTYEGEAAMYLQAMAATYVDANGFEMEDSYFKGEPSCFSIPTASLIQGIVVDITNGKAKNYIAAKFHCSLVLLIDIIAKQAAVERICFSGGVFQNDLLVDWIKRKYGSRYQLYFHQQLSPNDENISFGQLVYYDNDLTTVKSNTRRQQKLIIHN